MSSWAFLLLSLSALSFGVLLTSPAAGATHVVPDNQPTIQAAIDSSASGDTVLVQAGTYHENLRTLGKSLVLKSLGGPESTIIDGSQQGSVIWVTGADAIVRIEGFTIQNGLNTNGGGGGVFVEGTESPYEVQVALVANIILTNAALWGGDLGLGGGVYLRLTARNCLIAQNVFKQNYAGDSGGGFEGTYAQITGNVFIGNGCHVGGGAISGGGHEIIDNLILQNWADSFGGGVDVGTSIIRGNTIVGNYINNGAIEQAAGVSIRGESVVENNIIVWNHGPPGRGTGIGLQCGSETSTISIACNDIWSNDINYYSGGGCDTTGLGNISADPRFCDPEASDFQIESNSPCAPENASCGLIGKCPVGCISVPVRSATWGVLKTLFDRSSGRK